MVLSSWLCSSSSTKNIFVKIVHPGGHVELYDKPVLAGEIMLRYPKFYVSHPNVFEQPWAIVAPETMLMLGEKFYVVPTGTIRKLQRHSPKNSSFSSPLSREMNTNRISKEEEDHNGNVPSCCLTIRLRCCMKQCDNDGEMKVYKCCYTKKSTGKDHVENRGNLCRENGLITKKSKEFTINGKRSGSPKRFASFDNWQPSLESITEE